MFATLDKESIAEKVRLGEAHFQPYGDDPKFFLIYQNNIYANRIKHYERIGVVKEKLYDNNYRYERAKAP